MILALINQIASAIQALVSKQEPQDNEPPKVTVIWNE